MVLESVYDNYIPSEWIVAWCELDIRRMGALSRHFHCHFHESWQKAEKIREEAWLEKQQGLRVSLHVRYVFHRVHRTDPFQGGKHRAGLGVCVWNDAVRNSESIL